MTTPHSATFALSGLQGSLEQRIIDAIPAHLAVLDSDGRILQTNAALRTFAARNGANTDAITGANYLAAWQELTGADATRGAEAQAGISAVLRNDLTRFEMEYSCDSPGGIRWFRLLVAPLSADGAGQGVLLLHIDVTARKQAEDLLRENEARMIAAQRVGRFGSWEIDLTLPESDSSRLHWSDQMYRLCGYEPGEFEITNQLFFAWVPQEDHAAIRAAVSKAIQQHQPYSIVHRLIRKDGKEILVEETAQVFRDPSNGRPLKLIGTAHDVTDRKHAEEQIREQAALLDETQDAIFLKDLDHRITFWSKAAERLYGWTREEAVGRSAAGFILASEEQYYTISEHVMRSGQWSGELHKRTRDGRELIVNSRWSLVRDANGQPKSVLTLDTDITEQKKLQAQFLRAQRMESIGTLAGGIAHDLNNVLSPILMIADLLRGRVQAEDEELVETIRKAAERGANLVKQVLSFARGVHGQRVPVQPAKVAADLQKIIQETFPKSIQLQTFIPETFPEVLGDPIQIHQVLLNLAVNARDAMEEGGRLTIALHTRTVDESFVNMHPEARVGKYAVVEVSDTGCGIPPDIQGKIFEPFFTTKDVGKGTGLGLSTALAIVKSHGGFITLRSHPGQGSTFEVHLPVSPGSRGADMPSRRSMSLPRGSGEVILVIDDEESIRDITKKTLETFGYQVLLAANGAEGLSIFTANQDRIAAVITDLAMPVMDGPTTIAALRRLSAALPIISCSGFAAKARNENGEKISAFIPKPYTTEALVGTVAAALGKSAAPPDESNQF